MLMVVTLTVRRDALDSFRTFEHEAARIMQKHGGALERAVVLRTKPEEPHKEVHVVSFPSADAYEAYRVSPELAAFMHLREVSVTKTEIAMGDPGPVYGQEP